MGRLWSKNVGVHAEFFSNNFHSGRRFALNRPLKKKSAASKARRYVARLTESRTRRFLFVHGNVATYD